MKPRNTWRSRYPGFGWSVGPDRTTRTVTAVAAAGLIGTVIGGFSAFGVFNALSPPPRQETAAAPVASARTVYGTVPDPSVGITAGPPVEAPAAAAQPAQPQISPPQLQQSARSAPPPQQAAPAQASALPPGQGQSPQTPPAQGAAPVQVPQKSWPDALSRAHPDAGGTQAASPPPVAPAQQAPAVTKADAGKAEDANKANTNASTVNNPDSANKADAANTDSHAAPTQSSAPAQPQRRSYARKHAVITKPQRAAVDDTWRRETRPVYDYFWSNTVRDRNDGDAASNGAALSGMRPPHNGHAGKTTRSRYVRSRHVPADASAPEDTRQQRDYRRDSYEERDRGGGTSFGGGNWHEDDDD